MAPPLAPPKKPDLLFSLLFMIYTNLNVTLSAKTSIMLLWDEAVFRSEGHKFRATITVLVPGTLCCRGPNSCIC